MWGSEDHNDYLGHAVERSFGLASAVQPRKLSHFESALPGDPYPDESISNGAGSGEPVIAEDRAPSVRRPVAGVKSGAEILEPERFEMQTIAETSAPKGVPSTHAHWQHEMPEKAADAHRRMNPPNVHHAVRQAEREPDLEIWPVTDSPNHTSPQRGNLRFEQPHTVQGEPHELATIRTVPRMPDLPTQQTRFAPEDAADVLNEESFGAMQEVQPARAWAEVEPALTQPPHLPGVVPRGVRRQTRSARSLNAQSLATLSASGPNAQTGSATSNDLSNPINPTSAMPTIHVTIGRVEVRAVPPPHSSTRKPAEAKPGPSLDDYLRVRNGSTAGGGR